MAIDVWVGDHSATPAAWLEGGYYWFLHPLFETLRAETGRYVDLYGDATFAGPDLDALERTLAEARRLVEARPAAWEVCVGSEVSPRGRTLYGAVDRAEFLRLLDAWQEAVNRARRVGQPLTCVGD